MAGVGDTVFVNEMAWARQEAHYIYAGVVGDGDAMVRFQAIEGPAGGCRNPTHIYMRARDGASMMKNSGMRCDFCFSVN